MTKQVKDEKLIDFDPSYPSLLPEDWKDRSAPTIYEILATTNTLKRIYSDTVQEIESGEISNDIGEESLRKIATNYQSVKSLLFQPR